ncbi:unnamed protein product [Effrenium voratum]|nr:unnamed protein product [Effrenium voratum]
MLIPLRVAHDCPGQDAALYVDTLAVLLDDSVPAVQAAALEALGQCGQESHAYACAVCRLAAPDTQAAMHSLVRCSALKTLGAMEASGFAPEVAGCFQAEEPCVREAALKAFAAFGEDGKEFLMEVEMLRFKGLDELGGAPYEVLVSFKATVMYPYDVALAIFYELYSMCMPLLMPNLKLLPFFVFRGLHSGAEYHYVRNQSGQLFPGVGVGLPPFVPPMDTAKWFHASAAWSLRTDFAQFPHILRFGSVAELLQLLKSDWAQVARAMRRFNQETLSASAGLWAYAVAAALSGNAGNGAGLVLAEVLRSLKMRYDEKSRDYEALKKNLEAEFQRVSLEGGRVTGGGWRHRNEELVKRALGPGCRAAVGSSQLRSRLVGMPWRRGWTRQYGGSSCSGRAAGLQSSAFEPLVVDGPLRQPLSDYINGSSQNEAWTTPPMVQSALHALPQARRVSFEELYPSTRTDAMRLAVMEATAREMHAKDQLSRSPSPLSRSRVQSPTPVLQRAGARPPPALIIGTAPRTRSPVPARGAYPAPALQPMVTHGIRAVATSPLRAPAPFPASRPLAAPGSIDLPDLKQAFEALKTDVQSLRQQLGALTTRAREGSKPDTASEGQTAGPLC